MWKMLQLMPCMYHQYHISTPFLSFLMLHGTNKQTNPCDQNIILTSCNNQNDDTNRYKAIMNYYFCPFSRLSIFFALTFFSSKNPIMFFIDKTPNTKKNNDEQCLETPN